MKKLTLTCLLPLLIAANPLIAQVKKAPAKPVAPAAAAKPKPAAVKIPVLAKLDPFSKKPDDLVQFLNDEFKKLNLTLNDIDETTQHLYEGTRQLDGVLSTTKELTFTNKASATIIADANDKVTEFRVELAGKDTIRYKAIRSMLAFTTWPAIYKGDADTTYKNGNIIAYAGTGHTLDDDGEIEDSYFHLSVQQTLPYRHQPKAPVAFNSKALTLNDNAEDVGYSVVKLLEGLGFNLLYKQAESPVVIDNQLSEYTTW